MPLEFSKYNAAVSHDHAPEEQDEAKNLVASPQEAATLSRWNAAKHSFPFPFPNAPFPCPSTLDSMPVAKPPSMLF